MRLRYEQSYWKATKSMKYFQIESQHWNLLTPVGATQIRCGLSTWWKEKNSLVWISEQTGQKRNVLADAKMPFIGSEPVVGTTQKHIKVLDRKVSGFLKSTRLRPLEKAYSLYLWFAEDKQSTTVLESISGGCSPIAYWPCLRWDVLSVHETSIPCPAVTRFIYSVFGKFTPEPKEISSKRINDFIETWIWCVNYRSKCLTLSFLVARKYVFPSRQYSAPKFIHIGGAVSSHPWFYPKENFREFETPQIITKCSSHIYLINVQL